MTKIKKINVIQEVWIDRYEFCDCCTDADAYAATYQCPCKCHTVADEKKKDKKNNKKK